MTKVAFGAWTDVATFTENWFTLKYQMWAQARSNDDIANNRTYVWRQLVLTVTGGGSLSAISYEYTATGMPSASGSSVSFTAGDYVLLSSEGYVNHNSDGTWSQAVSGSTNFGNSIFWSCSGTAELETIPRTSHPTVSTASTNIGNRVTVNTNRASTSFTHTVTAKFGSSTTVHNIATNVTTSTTFDSANFVSALVNAQSSGKTTVVFTVTTYSGSTEIGTDTCSLTIVIAPSVPTVNSSTVEIGNTITISTNRISTTSARTHTIQYKIGSGSYTNLQSNVTTSTTFNTLNYVETLVSNASSNKVTVTFRCYTYINNTSIGSKTVSATVTLSPSVPTVNPSTFTMGDTITISSNRIATNRTHTLYVVISGTSTKVGSTGGIGASNTYQTTGSSTIGGKIIQAAGTTGKSVSGTFRLETILNGTIIGSKSVSFTANVNTNVYKPTITWGAMSDRNATVAQYHASNAMINSLSNLRQVITFGTTPAYEELASATITLGSVKQTLSASDMSSAYNFDVNNVSANKITVSVTDKRGTTVTDSKTFTLVGYASPTLSKSSVTRVNMTGDKARYSLSGTGYAGTYTGTATLTNSISVSYRVREVGDTYPSNFTALDTSALSGSGSSPWSLSAQFTNLFDYTKQYDIQFRIEDGFGSLTRITKTLRLYNGTPVFGWAETHFDVYGKFHIHDRTNASERWVLPDGLDAIMFSQGSKNLLQCTSETTTVRGVEYNYDTWNRPTCNGTASGGNSYVLYGWFTCQRAGSYILSGCPVGGGGSLYYLQIQDSESNAIGNDYGNGFTIENCVYGQKYKVYIIIQDGQTVTNVKFAPMIRYSTIASSAYSPFAPVFSLLPNFALMARGTISNANSATDLGIYRITSGTGTPATSGLLVTLSPYLWADTSTLRWQVFLTSTPAMYIRYRDSSGTWGSWRQVTTTTV